MCQGCAKGGSRVCQGCVKGVSEVFHGCFQAISWVFKGTTRLFQECSDVILEYVTGVPRVFLGSSSPIEFIWVAAMTSVYKNKPFFGKNIQNQS